MNKGFDEYGCMTPWHEMYVKPNGRAKPCCASDPKKDFHLQTNLLRHLIIPIIVK